MRAIVQARYGSIDDLELREIPTPVPAADEVLIQVRAASVHPDVWHVVTGQPTALRLMGSGVRRPKRSVPGTDVAGVVVAVGRNVTRFRRGDEVFGETIRGNQWRNGGAYAEYATAPEEGLALKPVATSFEEAAAVPTLGLIALNNLPLPRVPAGHRVLVNGAAGGVGSVAVQLARSYGAEVTAVDGPHKLDLLRDLGVDRTIDYTVEDFTRSSARWDLIFDVPGSHSFAEIRRVLNPGGRYVLIGHDAFGATGHRWLGSIPRMLGLVVRSAFTPELRGGSLTPPDKRSSMATLSDLLTTSQLRVPIARAFPLAEAGQALHFLASGQAVGRVVLVVSV